MKLEKYLTEKTPMHHSRQVILKQVANITAAEVDSGVINFNDHDKIQKAIKKILKI